MDIKKQCAIFIDIDGTLLWPSHRGLNRNLKTIQAVRRLGHKVFISTGRASSYIPPEIHLAENFDGIIAAGGAYVRLGNTEIAKRLMPYEAVKTVCRYFLKHNIPGALEGEHNMYYFADMSFRESDWISLNEETLNDFITEDIPIMKFSIDGQAPIELAEILGDDYTLLQHASYSEIFLKGCSKAVGIEAIISELGIEREQTIAIGDSMNDIEMIEYAEIGIAMGNAIDKIKRSADMITDTVENAGVSKALEKIFLH